MPDVVCEHCGGTDFYKEAGYYYCNECQIQSQEIQEHVFQDNADKVNVKTSRKLKSDKTDKTENKITSWECYNFILLGLTEELINLGANAKLKSVVKILWLMYLEKLQVFSRDKDGPPKLQAVSSGVDAAIIYGKLLRRKRKTSNKSSSDEVDVTTLDSGSVRRERAKKKRALMQAHYEDFTQKSQGTSSLHNETLTSLQTGSETSKKSVAISYNVFASKELRKKQSAYHLRKHKTDFGHNLTCHKMSYRKVSRQYRSGPYILSLNKLYGILYLGLLIIKDKIHLSDMLRYMKEGQLSFNCYSHLLPQDFADKMVNFKNFKKNTFFTHLNIRSLTLQLAELLNVQWYVPCQNLIELCERYCKELNLPDAICNCAKNIISRTTVRMSFSKTPLKSPNYEARVLSIILFVLKLLFGLDDVTEFELGKYSHILNKSRNVQPKMFDVVLWLKYIELRRLILEHYHFPSSAHEPDFQNTVAYLNFISNKSFPEQKFNKIKDDFHQLLSKLNENCPLSENIDFPASLTPSLDSIKVLFSHGEGATVNDFSSSIISRDFSRDSLVHILNPNAFLKLLNEGKTPEIINGGANNNFLVEEIICSEQDNKLILRERRKLVTVKLCFPYKNSKRVKSESNAQQTASDKFKEDFYYSHENDFSKNAARLTRVGELFDVQLEDIREDLKRVPDVYSKHFQPYERYWMRIRHRLEALSHKDCRKHLNQFPYNFRLVFSECRAIAQQSEEDFLVEFQQTELYLIYLADFGLTNFENKEVKSKKLRHILEKLSETW